MPRILVVDDSRIARMGMRRILERAGHEVVEADSGETGLRALEAPDHGIDCVTVDVLMPGMGGIEFLQETRTRGLGIQVIVCTADIQKSTRDECHQRGAWGVVSKPVDADALLALIASSSAQGEKHSLTDEQRDWLTELVNMGVGRAAAALNDLVEGHVELRVPYVDVVGPQQLKDAVGVLSHTPVSSVQMGFHGGLDGFAFLVFPQRSAVELVGIVSGDETDATDLDSIHAATLTEIGNIVISAVMGTLANVIERALQYSLPVYELQPVMDLLAPRQADNPLILVARTSFTIRRSVTIEGHLLLLFELKSFDSLIGSILDASS